MGTRLVDLSKGDTRNMQRGADGRLYVREGFRRVYEPESGTTIIAAHSIKHPLSEIVWHYLVIDDGGETKARILDEDLTTVVQNFALGSARATAVTVTVSNDQVFISSPDFATAWGYVGGPLAVEKKKESVNPNTGTIENPRGLSVDWAQRRVIARGSLLYFGDPLEPRTFAGANVLYGPWASPIYGLHVAQGGMLVVAAESGLWSLPESAAASGQIVLGQWSKVTDFRTMAYNVTCETRGEIWGLTKDGVRRLYPEGEEIKLWEVSGPRGDASAYFDVADIRGFDLREGRLIPTQNGLIVVFERAETCMMHVVDLAQGFRSWWSPPDLGDGDDDRRLMDVMSDPVGDDLWVFRGGICRLRGNFDGEAGLETAFTRQPAGYMAKSENFETGSNDRVREVRIETDATQLVQVGVNGTWHLTPIRAAAPVAGTDTWDDPADPATGDGVGTLGFDRLDMGTHKPDVAGREFFFEALVVGASQRVEAMVEVSGPSRRRKVRA